MFQKTELGSEQDGRPRGGEGGNWSVRSERAIAVEGAREGSRTHVSEAVGRQVEQLNAAVRVLEQDGDRFGAACAQLVAASRRSSNIKHLMNRRKINARKNKVCEQ